jgi:hypothetical protein
MMKAWQKLVRRKKKEIHSMGSSKSHRVKKTIE